MVSLQCPRRIRSLALLTLTVSLWSCSGGGRSSSGPAFQATGDVALLVTDAPSDDYAEILVTIRRVQFLAETRRVETFRGERTIDLLKLRSESVLFSLASGVPVDDYEKIRLDVSRVVVVKKDANGNPGESVETKLPANGKIDLNPRGTIHVGAGATIIVQLDLDANNSIHVVQAGQSEKILFRPVVFVKVLTFKLDGKLVRLEGFVEDLDLQGGTFRLCPDGTSFVHAATRSMDDDGDDDGDDGDDDPVSGGMSSDDDERRCVTVALDEDSSLFDSQALLLPLEQLAAGDKVTVIGHLRFDREGDFMRLDTDHSRLVLDAAVIELWADEDTRPFSRVKGLVLSAPGDDPDCPEGELCDPVFGFRADPEQLEVAERDFLVELVEGARVFGRDGLERSPDAIREGLRAVLDAALFPAESGSDRLRAPLVILDGRDGPPLEKLEGEIVSIAADGSSLVLQLGGDEPREVCVDITGDTHVVLLLIGDGGFDSERIGVEDLEPGMDVDVFAEPPAEGDAGCFAAQDILLLAVTDVVVDE